MTWWNRLGSLASEGERFTPKTIKHLCRYLSTCSTSMDGQFLVLSYQRIRSHMMIMIFLFLKLSNGARYMLQQVWCHEAAIKLKALSGKAFYMQCKTWRDKKQVLFLSLNEVGYTGGLTVKIYANKEKNQENITSPCSQRAWVKYFNDVDKNDQGSSFYLTITQTIF